jgi:hypothetical protein
LATVDQIVEADRSQAARLDDQAIRTDGIAIRVEDLDFSLCLMRGGIEHHQLIAAGVFRSFGNATGFTRRM